MNKATKRQIIRRSENEKLDLIDHREQSGLSIKRFCNQLRLSDSLFHSWLNKYCRHTNKAAISNNKIIRLSITTPSPIREHSCSLFAEVILEGGCRIKF
jgi:transposase-like protein